MSEVAELLRNITGVHLQDNLKMFDAKVLSVDSDLRTCEVILLSGKSSNTITCRLMASVNDGCLMIPEVRSTVIVTMSDYVQPYVSQYSGIQNIVWLGGEYDGVPIVSHPTDNTKGLLVKINNLENTRTKNPVLNFGGQNAELWCEGGEIGFITQMIYESAKYPMQCLWFTTLVSKKENLSSFYKTLNKEKAHIFTID